MHTDRWRVIGASVPGTSHEKLGQPCQDAHCWADLGRGRIVLAVADGAGTAHFGEVGSTIAAAHAVESVARSAQHYSPGNEQWQPILQEAMLVARSAVESEAATRQLRPRDLATTLILVVATPDLVATAQVGDGAAVAMRGGDCVAVTTVHNGEYINHTDFITSPDGLQSARYAVHRVKVDRVAVLSDGLQGLAMKMPEGTPHAPFFEPLFRFIAAVSNERAGRQQLVAFLRSPRITARADDDLTLLLAAHVPA